MNTRYVYIIARFIYFLKILFILLLFTFRGREEER